MPTYDLGDGIPLEHQVTDADGNLTDATVAIALTRPNGTTFTAPSITHPSTGTYRATPVPDAVGTWAGAWSTSGSVISTSPFTFAVADPAPATYADLATVKAMLGKLTNDDRDEMIQLAITASSRAIDRRCGRRFYADKTATTRTFRASPRVSSVDLDQVLMVDDIASSTGVTIATGSSGAGSGGTYTAFTNFDLGPFDAATRLLPFSEIRGPVGWLLGFQLVQVTAKWGWPAVPDEIAQATALMATRLYRRKDSPQGVLGSSDWGLMRVSRVDPDVEALIAPYINPVIV
jgi:hypothetical protein